MIYVQKVSATYKGRGIATHPARYPWWKRLLARLTRKHLPEQVPVDTVMMQFTIQGPSPEFVEKEANHRIQVNLTIYEITISGEVEITEITRGPIVGRPWPRPLRDFSPSMSQDFRAWMGSFS